MSLALLLAAMCVAEVDFDREVECRRMWGINLKTSLRRGIPLEQQVREYNSIFKVGRRGQYVVTTPRARWVRALQAGDQSPAGWPQQLPWAGPRKRGAPSYQQRWLSLQAAAVAFLEAPGKLPRADHYGGDCSDDRYACDAVPPCWRRVYYPNSAQAYWEVPRRECKLARVRIAAR